MAIKVATSGGGGNALTYGHNAVTDNLYLNSFSVFCWARQNSVPYFSSNAVMFSKGDTRVSAAGLFALGTANDGLGTNNNVEVHSNTFNSTDAAWVFDGAQDTNWHSHGASYLNSSAADVPIFYLDGVAKSVLPGGAFPTSGSRSPSDTQPIIVGNDAISISTDNFPGSVAHCAIWSCMLTPVEHLLLANGWPPDDIRPDALIFYTPLSGSGIKDSMSYGRAQLGAGTVAGTPVTVPEPPVHAPGQSDIREWFDRGINVGGVAHPLALTLTQTQVASLAKQAGKQINDNQSQVASIFKAVAHSVTETQSQAVTAQRLTGHVVPKIAQSQVASLTALKTKLVSVVLTQSQVASLAKVINKSVTIAQSQVASLVKIVSHALTQAQSQVLSIVKAVSRAIVLAQSQVASLVPVKHAGGVNISIAQSQVASLVKQVGKLVTASQSQSPSVQKTVAKTVTATQSQVASLVAIKARLLTLSVAQSQVVANVARSIAKALIGSQAQSPLLTKQVSHRVTLLQAETATLIKQVNKAIADAQGQVVAIALVKARSVAVALSQSQAVSLARSMSKNLSVVQGQAPSLIKQVSRTISQIQSQVASVVAARTRALGVAIVQSQTWSLLTVKVPSAIRIPNPLYVVLAPLYQWTVTAPRYAWTALAEAIFPMQAVRKLPAIDATIQTITIPFDFGPQMPPGVTISSVQSVNVSVYSGVDSAPSSRKTGAAVIGTQPVSLGGSGVTNAAVFQQFANCLGGVVYLIQVVVVLSNGDVLPLDVHLPCRTPT